MTGPTPVFDIGDSRTFTASLLNKLGMADDPSVLTVRVIEPDGVITEYAYPEDDEVSRVDQGVYAVDVLFTQKGRHQIKFIGSGDVVTAEAVEVFIRG